MYIPIDYKKMFNEKEINLQFLIENGFIRTSKKYKTITKRWDAYKKHYYCSIELSHSDFEEFENLYLDYIYNLEK